MYSAKKNYDRAIADYTHAIRLDPTDAGAYYDRGIAYAAKGQTDRAAADFRATLRLDPNNKNARDELKRIGAALKQ